VKPRENKNASRWKRDFAYVFSKRLKRKLQRRFAPKMPLEHVPRVGRAKASILSSTGAKASTSSRLELKPRPHPRLELHHHRRCRVLRSKPFPPSTMNRIRSPPQTSPPLSSPLSLPPPHPFEAIFKFGANMVYQFVCTHQGKGKGRAVVIPSPVQVLSKHPSTRSRKCTKVNVGRSAASFSQPPRYSAATNAEQTVISTWEYTDLGDPGRDDPDDETGGKLPET
jgi:hypothetical protein